MCVCPARLTSISVPLLGQLYYPGSVVASCCSPPFTVDAACHRGLSIARSRAGCCGLPDPVMKAFRCLETYYLPQLCIPELHSDVDCLYHSRDKVSISVLSAWK